jgi:hypothetical protein
MANGDPNSYSHEHLSISNFGRARPYGSPNTHNPRRPPRDRVEHANRLAQQLAAVAAAVAARDVRPLSGFSVDDSAAVLEVESAPNNDLPELERKQTDIRVGAVRALPNGAEQATLILPHGSLTVLTNAVDVYRDEDTPGGAPKQRALIEPIEFIRPGWLESLWTDPRPLPSTGEPIWWECWCFPDRTELLHRAAARLGLRVSEQRLFFPELTVIPVYAAREQIERILASINAISELRRATDTPSFFMRTVRNEQRPWVDELSARVGWPMPNAPAVCLLDTGVNRAHVLLADSLAETDMHAHDPEWGTTDDRDHGTLMAGLALFGDLMPVLASTEPIVLTHRLESVKLIEPPGMPRTDPQSYGNVTQAAIALPEITEPNRSRVYCMAASNQDVSGERPSSWSAALDQSAAGVSAGDETDADRLRRLIITAAGNIPDTASLDEIADSDEFPIEDPGQAWNAITVGGLTDKNIIDEPDLVGWSAYSAPGDLSPYSRASTDWRHSDSAIKPELVFEAGNRAQSPDGTELISGADSLSLLSVGADPFRPIDTFWATSAATAQAARLAAMIQSRYPNYWPETVRALMVHSASWSPIMLETLLAVGKPERRRHLRRFGYGVPSLQRALASAQNDLALIAENTLQPFKKETGRTVEFCDAHFYELPWPTTALEQLRNAEVHLKVTLSYFIEPSPGQFAPVAAYRYRSVGLRFAVKRAGEPVENFYRRVNRLDRDAARGPAPEDDPNWVIGPASISAGSLHNDLWIGPAIDLADRRHIAVYPVLGWWRGRPHLGHHSDKVRYALVVTLASPEVEVDLYSEIQNSIATAVEINV